MKRFYKEVSVAREPGGYKILLDGKTVLTPMKSPLMITAMPLAERVAEEWRGQGEAVLPDTMPLTQLSMTLMDRVRPHRAKLAAEMQGYLDTDLLCYLAEAPESHVKAQKQYRDPFLSWMKSNCGLCFETTTGLSPVTQSPETHRKIAAEIAGLTDEEFTAAYLVTLGAGSVIIALCFTLSEAFSARDVVDAVFLEEHIKDEIYLSDVYGAAPDQERREKALSADCEALRDFLMLAGVSA